MGDPSLSSLSAKECNQRMMMGGREGGRVGGTDHPDHKSAPSPFSQFPLIANWLNGPNSTGYGQNSKFKSTEGYTVSFGQFNAYLGMQGQCQLAPKSLS